MLGVEAERDRGQDSAAPSGYSPPARPGVPGGRPTGTEQLKHHRERGPREEAPSHRSLGYGLVPSDDLEFGAVITVQLAASGDKCVGTGAIVPSQLATFTRRGFPGEE